MNDDLDSELRQIVAECVIRVKICRRSGDEHCYNSDCKAAFDRK